MSDALEVGDIAKDFALPDASGRIVTLGDYMKDARLTVLEFISVYCDACKKKTPFINRLEETYKNRGVRVIAVALANAQPEVDALIRKWGIQFPLLADPDKKTYHLYGVHKVPQFFLIDDRGIIRYRDTAKKDKVFLKEVQALLQKVQRPLGTGDSAPAFALKNEYGDTVTIEFVRRHQNTILAFFTSDNWVNQETARALIKLEKYFSREGLRIYGIAYGSFTGNIIRFKKNCSIRFPVLMDKDDAVFRKYRVGSMPEIVIINETGRISKRILGKPHEELIDLLARSKAAFAPPQSEQDLMVFLQQSMPEARSIRHITLGDITVYVGTDNHGKKYYARHIEKEILCDVCGDVNFISTLSQDGRYHSIVLIKPFELYGTPLDASDFIKQFIGKSYHQPFVAGSNVDIITGATKSCMKLIEGLNETEYVFAKHLQDPSFDATFRAQLCFTEQAEIELAVDLYSREHREAITDIDLQKVAPYCTDGTLPVCPAGGEYKVIIFNGIPRVMCTVHGLNPQSSTFH